jgi:hypothetical protein
MRGSPDFSEFDPFKSFKKYGLDVGVSEFVVLTAIFAFSVLFLLIWWVRMRRNGTPEPLLLIGTTLVLVGVSLSLFFTWVSILRNYWIFPRQWLPGAFLVFIGLAFLVTVLLGYLRARKLKGLATVGAAAVWVLALAMIAFGTGREIHTAMENREWWDSLSPSSLETAEQDGYRFWDIAGNLNIKCGDTVWPELANFYDPSYSPEVALEEIKRLASSCEDSS